MCEHGNNWLCHFSSYHGIYRLPKQNITFFFFINFLKRLFLIPIIWKWLISHYLNEKPSDEVLFKLKSDCIFHWKNLCGKSVKFLVMVIKAEQRKASQQQNRKENPLRKNFFFFFHLGHIIYLGLLFILTWVLCKCLKA